MACDISDLTKRGFVSRDKFISHKKHFLPTGSKEDEMADSHRKLNRHELTSESVQITPEAPDLIFFSFFTVPQKI